MGDRFSDELEGWARRAGPKTLGSLVDVFGEKSFAVTFVVLLAVPALPLPTGGVTHVFEVIAMLLAVQLVANRNAIWLPRRARDRAITGGPDDGFMAGLLSVVRRLEAISRPRLTFAFRHRLSNVGFGLLVLGGSIAAFVAPPFTGLDTLPALGVVVLSLGVLLEDAVLVVAGVVVGSVGVVLEIALGKAAVDLLGDLI